MIKKLHILEFYLLIPYPYWQVFITKSWFYDEAIPAIESEETNNLDMFIPFFRIHEKENSDSS